MRRPALLGWRSLLAGAMLSLASVTVHAQTPTDSSVWDLDLGTVAVTPASGAAVPATGGATLRDLALPIAPTAAPTLADAARRIPSAHVQTNSRGEALVYLRGSGERQVALTLDGAPLTTPWDRRADLDLLPAWAIDGATVASGTPSIAWGPSALGGAVAFTSRRARSAGALTEVGLAGGWPAEGRLATAHVAASGSGEITLAADASARAGVPVPTRADLPFGQGGGLRTNTDRARASLLARLGRGDLAVTLVHAETARGIAPEAHLAPSDESVRYWRYPVARQSLAILNARGTPGPWRLRSTAWLGANQQSIEEFETVAYERVSATQHDRDLSGGTRLLAELPRAWGVLRAAGFGLLAQHHIAATDEPAERFRHAEGSLGIEAETAGRVRLAGGVAVDALAPIETGARPEAGPFVDIAGHLGLVAQWTDALAVRAGGGRKTRFPSMRELFGGALGRFALNPDLRPEAAWLGEVGLRLERPTWDLDAVVFARDVSGTIEQIQLTDGRRQRVNLGGSWAVGLEATASARPIPALRLDGAVTLLRQRSDAGDRLTERPGAMGRLAAELRRGGWRVRAEAAGIGGVVSPTPDGLAELPGAVVVDAKIVRQWVVSGSVLEVSARVDNAADALHVPQSGLPAPGRSAALGVRLLL